MSEQPIVIVTDSTADIPAHVREELGIEMVPLKVHFGSETYRDGIDLTPEQFMQKLTGSSVLPTTSQPSPVEFLETYKKLTQQGKTVLSIHLSAALSGTFQSAVLAKSMVDGKADIEVVDSRSASYGIGMQAVAAARAAREGKSKEHILDMIETMRRNANVYFLVDTLEYLQKGGRIGRAAALIGSLLNIKPILSLGPTGEVIPFDKVRGHKKAVARIVDQLVDDAAGRPVHLTLAHAGARAEAEVLYEQLRSRADVLSVEYTHVGPVIGTHTGPGVIAGFIVTE